MQEMDKGISSLSHSTSKANRTHSSLLIESQLCAEYFLRDLYTLFLIYKIIIHFVNNESNVQTQDHKLLKWQNEDFIRQVFDIKAHLLPIILSKDIEYLLCAQLCAQQPCTNIPQM